VAKESKIRKGRKQHKSCSRGKIPGGTRKNRKSQFYTTDSMDTLKGGVCIGKIRYTTQSRKREEGDEKNRGKIMRKGLT